MCSAHSIHKEHDVAGIGSASNIHGSHNTTGGQGYKVSDIVRDSSSSLVDLFIKRSGSVACGREIRDEIFQLGTVTFLMTERQKTDNRTYCWAY